MYLTMSHQSYQDLLLKLDRAAVILEIVFVLMSHFGCSSSVKKKEINVQNMHQVLLVSQLYMIISYK